MCISTGEADFTGTIVYGGRRDHPRHGLIDVLGYQNVPRSLSPGPNAMVLHLPAQGLTRANFISAGRHGDLLTRMRDAVDLRPDTRGAMDWMSHDDVDVFEHDVYTVVLAGNPSLIPDALLRVPEPKRPVLSRELFQFYSDVFPGHSVALCCFDNARAQQAKPLLLWYPVAERDRIVLPALDCHTGAAPDLDALVQPDHWVLFSTDEAPDGWGERVPWPHGVRDELREFLPYAVVGRYFRDQPLPNGDFAIGYDDLLEGEVDRIHRVTPGGA